MTCEEPEDQQERERDGVEYRRLTPSAIDVGLRGHENDR